MIKAVLIDLDGVIIKARHKYFSNRLSEEHNIPLDDILVFFKNEYGATARGKASIREVLPKYLAEWGWQGTLDEFLEYWFAGERDVDQKVIDEIQKFRKAGMKVYIVSDNEQERVEYLNRELGLSSLVDGGFYSYQLGYKKSEVGFFREVLGRLELEPLEVVYIDDDPENVEIGKEVQLRCLVYEPEMAISEAEELRTN